MQLNSEGSANDLAEGLSSDGPADADRSLLTEEVKIGCTLGMLQCLDRPHRLAYVLGEILDLPGPDAADALGSPLHSSASDYNTRARQSESFTRTYCGLASDTAACACHRRVPAAMRVGRIRGETVDFAGEASSYQETRLYVRRVEEARWALEVHRTSHPRASSVDFARRLVHALDSQRSP
jgi:hypothetical protein